MLFSDPFHSLLKEQPDYEVGDIVWIQARILRPPDRHGYLRLRLLGREGGSWRAIVPAALVRAARRPWWQRLLRFFRRGSV